MLHVEAKAKAVRVTRMACHGGCDSNDTHDSAFPLHDRCNSAFHASNIDTGDFAAVQYGLERMNQEVSLWMRGLHNPDGSRPTPPFFATG